MKHRLIKPGDLLHNCLVISVYEPLGVGTNVVVQGRWLRQGRVAGFEISTIHISGCHWCQYAGLGSRKRGML